MTKGERDDEPTSPRRVQRFQVPQACTTCRRMHLRCSMDRPCQRCNQKGIADTCNDIPRKKPVKKFAMIEARMQTLSRALNGVNSSSPSLPSNSSLSSPSVSSSSSPSDLAAVSPANAPEIAAALLRNARRQRAASQFLAQSAPLTMTTSSSSLADLSAIASSVREAASASSGMTPSDTFAGASSVTGSLSLTDMSAGLARAGSTSSMSIVGASAGAPLSAGTPSQGNVALFGSNSLEQFASLSTLLAGATDQSISGFSHSSLSSLFPASAISVEQQQQLNGQSLTSLPSLSSFLALSPHASAANGAASLPPSVSAQNIASFVSAALSAQQQQQQQQQQLQAQSAKGSMPPPMQPVNGYLKYPQNTTPAPQQPQATAQTQQLRPDYLEAVFSSSEPLRKLWMTAMQGRN